MTPAFLPTAKFMAGAIYGIDIGALTPVKAVTQLDYPVLIIHGMHDDRVGVDHGERVAEASGSPSARSGGQQTPLGTLSPSSTYPDEYTERVDGYFAELLK